MSECRAVQHGANAYLLWYLHHRGSRMMVIGVGDAMSRRPEAGHVLGEREDTEHQKDSGYEHQDAIAASTGAAAPPLQQHRSRAR